MLTKSATGIRNTTVWKKLFKFQRDGVVGAIDNGKAGDSYLAFGREDASTTATKAKKTSTSGTTGGAGGGGTGGGSVGGSGSGGG